MLLPWALEAAILLASIAVWGGVYMEDERFAEKIQKLGWKILLFGLALETAAGMFLFADDAYVIAGLTLKANNATKTAAQAQLADDQLKTRVIWRNTTPAQCESITANLIAYSGSVLIEFPIGDPEAMTYAWSLEYCFLNVARWNAAWTAISLNHPIPELSVFGPDKSSVSAVISGFHKIGIPVAPDGDSIDKTVPFSVVMTGFVKGSETVEIIIGSRPVF